MHCAARFFSDGRCCFLKPLLVGVAFPSFVSDQALVVRIAVLQLFDFFWTSLKTRCRLHCGRVGGPHAGMRSPAARRIVQVHVLPVAQGQGLWRSTHGDTSRNLARVRQPLRLDARWADGLPRIQERLCRTRREVCSLRRRRLFHLLQERL